MGGSARIWNYNPDPVWVSSAFWISVAQASPHRWAQIGWVKDATALYDTGAYERVFLQIKNGPGSYSTLFYQSNGSWTDEASTAVSPTSEDLYEVYQSGDNWFIRYDYGTAYTEPHTFTPHAIVVGGETKSYQPVSGGIAKGDHAPGDRTNKIRMNNIKKNVNGSWSSATLGPGERSDLPMKTDRQGGSGESFRIWDDRCSS